MPYHYRELPVTLHHDVWDERDRLSIRLIATMPAGNETDVLCFWDDDARDLIEDGFFDPRNPLDSLTDYALSLGFLRKV